MWDRLRWTTVATVHVCVTVSLSAVHCAIYTAVIILNIRGNTLSFSCRSLNGIRGVTRETLVALTTTIESREWMRRRRVSVGLPPEHPRASSTDDVECFFSILRNTIGVNFTTRAVMLEWRKVCNEFSKRINP